MDLYAKAKIGSISIKLPVVNISIGGLGVLVTEGFSHIEAGKEILIETLEKKGNVIATSIKGRIAYLGSGVPSRVGIDFSPVDTPIYAYSELKGKNAEKTIKDKNEIHLLFKEIEHWTKGHGDVLIIHKQKAIPAEFFYLRPQTDNIVLRIVDVPAVSLPFQPELNTIYPFYLFKGIDVFMFYAKVINVIKNIIETEWPADITFVSRRNILRYYITGQEPLIARLIHPIDAKQVRVFIWDISPEGMGVEILDDESAFLRGMFIPSIKIQLPSGELEVNGTVRYVTKDEFTQKVRLGIEFSGKNPSYQDKIINYIMEKNLPSDMLFKEKSHNR